MVKMFFIVSYSPRNGDTKFTLFVTVLHFPPFFSRLPMMAAKLLPPLGCCVSIPEKKMIGNFASVSGQRD